MLLLIHMKGSILKHLPAVCCALHSLFVLLCMHNPMLSGYIKLHDFRLMHLLRVDTGVVLSNHIHTIIHRGVCRPFDSRISQGALPALYARSTCEQTHPRTTEVVNEVVTFVLYLLCATATSTGMLTRNISHQCSKEKLGLS